MASPITAPAALLQALIKGPSYGLELITRVEEQTKGQVKLRQGTIYPLLREMENDGLLDSYESEPMPERGGRPRRYYRLTAEGAKRATQDRITVASVFRLELAHG